MALRVEDLDLDGQYEAGVNSLSEAELVAKGWNDPRAAPIGYWRIPDARMTRGRVTLLQYGMNALERLERGHQQLRAYGTYKSDNGPGGWVPWQDPYLGIVQRDGLREFDAQQILDLGWYRRPGRMAKQSHREVWKRIQTLIDDGMTEEVAVRTVLPQLREHDLRTYVCDYCPDRQFASAALVRRHESLAHREDVRSREIRDSISEALRESGANQGSVVTAIEHLVQAMAAQQAAAPARPSGSRRRSLALDLTAPDRDEDDAEDDARL